VIQDATVKKVKDLNNADFKAAEKDAWKAKGEVPTQHKDSEWIWNENLCVECDVTFSFKIL
jgi:hypothetical protein